jgi:hypothetical protein
MADGLIISVCDSVMALMGREGGLARDFGGSSRRLGVFWRVVVGLYSERDLMPGFVDVDGLAAVGDVWLIGRGDGDRLRLGLPFCGRELDLWVGLR